MFNDILNDIWNNYRGRLLCSVFGLFIGVVVLWLGFFQALFLMICIGLGLVLFHIFQPPRLRLNSFSGLWLKKKKRRKRG